MALDCWLLWVKRPTNGNFIVKPHWIFVHYRILV
jgi:hypothetical protein